MTESRSDGPVVVLLGAGASVDAGLLTSTALTEAIYTDLRGRWVSENKLSRLVGYIIAKLQLRKAKAGGGPFQLIDVEELFDALNSLLHRDKLVTSEFVERWDSFLDSFDDDVDTHSLSRSLGDIVVGVIKENANRRSSFVSTFGMSGDIKRFVEALKPKSQFSMSDREADMFRAPFISAMVARLTAPPKAGMYFKPLLESSRVKAVATLNYDMVVENCCQEIDREFDYGLSRWQHQRRVDWRPDPMLRLIKLHGSLNWVGTPDEFSVRDEDIKSHEQRVMIFGGGGHKLSAAGPFLQFLTSFERSILRAGHLLVIGYSFRDAHVNAIIRRWRLTRRNSILTVVDPGEPDFRSSGIGAGAANRKVGEKVISYHLDVRHIKAGANEGIRTFFLEPQLV